MVVHLIVGAGLGVVIGVGEEEEEKISSRIYGRMERQTGSYTDSGGRDVEDETLDIDLEQCRESHPRFRDPRCRRTIPLSFHPSIHPHYRRLWTLI